MSSNELKIPERKQEVAAIPAGRDMVWRGRWDTGIYTPWTRFIFLVKVRIWTNKVWCKDKHYMLCKLYFLCKCIQRCITVCCLYTHNLAGNIIKTRQVICLIYHIAPPPLSMRNGFLKKGVYRYLVR